MTQSSLIQGQRNGDTFCTGKKVVSLNMKLQISNIINLKTQVMILHQILNLK